MECENCNDDHDGAYGSGRFCSSKCARSFSRNTDTTNNKYVNCVKCGEKVLVNKRANSKNCMCDTCRGFSRSNNTTNCLTCGKELTSHQTKYCCNQCQRDFEYGEYIQQWKSGVVDGMKGKYQTSGHIKRYLLEKYDYKCSKCGWNEVNPYTGNIPLELDHIDGNHKNNDESNITLLCPNCHSLTPTFRGANKGKGRKEMRKYSLYS